jgi:hypothetical protein
VISGFRRVVEKIRALRVVTQRTTDLSHKQENGRDRLSLKAGKELRHIPEERRSNRRKLATLTEGGGTKLTIGVTNA